MEENKDLYTELAVQLANEGQLTRFYRQKIGISYLINENGLNSKIYDFDGSLRAEDVLHVIDKDQLDYVDQMIILFASHEAQAREIYNQEIKSGKNPD
jgi:hypothetical protein